MYAVTDLTAWQVDVLGAAQPCRRVGAVCSEHPGRWISAGSLGAVWVESQLVGEGGPTRSVRRMMADVPCRWVGRRVLWAVTGCGGQAVWRLRLSRVRVTHGVAQQVPDRHRQHSAGPTELRLQRHNQVPGRGAEPGGADQRDEGHLLPRSSRAAGLVSSRDTRHLLKARLSHGLIRAAPVAGHPSRCDGTAEPSARWLGRWETPSARPQENRAAAFCEPSPDVSPLPPVGKVGGRPGA